MTGVPNGEESFNIRYNNSESEFKIVTAQIDTYNYNGKLDYASNNNLFDEDRINGSMNLVNGNGAATFELKNIQYDESGLFILNIVKVEKLGIAVEVHGKKEKIHF